MKEEIERLRKLQTDMADAIKRLEEEASRNGVVVSASVPADDLPELTQFFTYADANAIQKLGRADVVWMTNVLQDNDLQGKLRGKYVAVLKGQIRAWAESKQVVKAMLEMHLGDLAQHAIIFPVQVTEEEADTDWLEIQNHLGFDIHPA